MSDLNDSLVKLYDSIRNHDGINSDDIFHVRRNLLSMDASGYEPELSARNATELSIPLHSFSNTRYISLSVVNDTVVAWKLVSIPVIKI